MAKIDQNSLMPIGLAIVCIGGGAIWMTRQEFTTAANASGLSAMRAEFTDKQLFIEKKLAEILDRLSHIEGELDRIPKAPYRRQRGNEDE